MEAKGYLYQLEEEALLSRSLLTSPVAVGLAHDQKELVAHAL